MGRNTWDFWVYSEGWTHEETALILAGVIPDTTWDSYVDFNGEERHVSMLEIHRAENLLPLVRKRFPVEKIHPADFFAWAREMRFTLKSDLVEAAAKSLCLKPSDFVISDSPSISAEQVKEDGRQNRHVKVRYGILCAALRFLDTKSHAELKSYMHRTQGLNVEKLTEAIDKEREQFPLLRGNTYGSSARNIRDTLADALLETSRKIPE